MPTLTSPTITATPGQTIDLDGSGFDPKAKFMLDTVDAAGKVAGAALTNPSNINRPDHLGNFHVGINVPTVVGPAKVRAYQRGVIVAQISLTIAIAVPPPPPVDPPVDPPPLITFAPGFAAAVTGGAGKPILPVNTRDELAQALQKSDVQLQLGPTTIPLDAFGYLRGRNVSVLGSPSGVGTTLIGHPLYPADGAQNIVLAGFRQRAGWSGGQDGDAITTARGVSGIALINLSVSGYSDEAIDFWDAVTNATVYHCLIGHSLTDTHNYALLIGKHSERISVFQNIFAFTGYRNPMVAWDDATKLLAPGIVADVANNLIWKYQSIDENAYGTHVANGGRANVRNNIYRGFGPKASAAITIESNGQAFVQGNVSLDGKSIASSNSSLLPVPTANQLVILPTGTAAEQAALIALLKANCGVPIRDVVDQLILSDIVA